MNYKTALCSLLALWVMGSYSDNAARKNSYLAKLTGVPGQGYLLACEIGSNRQKLHLLLDTGSSNLIVAGSAISGSQKWYNASQSTTSYNTSKHMTVHYTHGNISGDIYEDIFGLPGLIEGDDLRNTKKFVMNAFVTPLLVVTRETQIFNSAIQPSLNGIIGFAYSELAVQPPGNQPNMQSIMDNLVKHLELADQFTTKFCGSTELNSGLTIVDTGTANIMLPSVVYRRFKEEVLAHFNQTASALSRSGSDLFRFGAKICQDIGGVDTPFPGDVYAAFPTVEFDILAQTGPDPRILRLSLSSQHSSKTLNVIPYMKQYLRYVGRSNVARANRDCFTLAVLESKNSDLVLGMSFLEGFEVLFNRRDKKVGFRTSDCVSYTQYPALRNSRVVGAYQWNSADDKSSAPEDCSPLLVSEQSATSLNALAIILITTVRAIQLSDVGVGALADGPVNSSSRTPARPDTLNAHPRIH
ncbi:unnamed protein product [Schistocephalus solidus]|uniref:Peptidase A1 domain-containing protein n=1 Tax=Schistocephalus solidus TaxID=70667 RepID=A0A183SGL1_SCHSO|nr:unnamed protein product [Schistocephalus solidus]